MYERNSKEKKIIKKERPKNGCKEFEWKKWKALRVMGSWIGKTTKK